MILLVLLMGNFNETNSQGCVSHELPSVSCIPQTHSVCAPFEMNIFYVLMLCSKTGVHAAMAQSFGNHPFHVPPLRWTFLMCSCFAARPELMQPWLILLGVIHFTPLLLCSKTGAHAAMAHSFGSNPFHSAPALQQNRSSCNHGSIFWEKSISLCSCLAAKTESSSRPLSGMCELCCTQQ